MSKKIIYICNDCQRQISQPSYEDKDEEIHLCGICVFVRVKHSLSLREDIKCKLCDSTGIVDQVDLCLDTQKSIYNSGTCPRCFGKKVVIIDN